MANKYAIDFEAQTKSNAMRQAQSFARHMCYYKTETADDFENFLKHPYDYKGFDKDEIESYMSYLNPENFYVIMQSNSLKADLQDNPDSYEKERWYSKHFK